MISTAERSSIQANCRTAWGVNLGLCCLTLASALLLSILLKKDNKKIGATDTEYVDASDITKNPALSVEDIEKRGEHVTAGRRLGGKNSGATSRYDT